MRAHDTLLPHTAAVTPESLRSCPGRGGIGTPRGGLGAHGEVPPPHSGGYTRVSPVLPGPRRDRGAPWGFGGAQTGPSPTQRRLHPSLSGPAWAAEGQGRPVGVWGRTDRSLPHTAAVTPESLRSCLGRGGIGTPRGGLGAHEEVPPPHTAAVTPESLRSCLGRGGIGTPRGGLRTHEEFPSPHSGSYTRVPPVLTGPRRDRDAPWGFGGTRRGPSPTQRRLQPSPSGPACAAEG